MLGAHTHLSLSPFPHAHIVNACVWSCKCRHSWATAAVCIIGMPNIIYIGPEPDAMPLVPIKFSGLWIEIHILLHLVENGEIIQYAVHISFIRMCVYFIQFGMINMQWQNVCVRALLLSHSSLSLARSTYMCERARAGHSLNAVTVSVFLSYVLV